MRRSIEDRFWSHVTKELFCWIWDHPSALGYGDFNVNGKKKKAHRWLFERTICLVPEGFELDHLCRNRACVRPDHLEIVTRRENVLRGAHPNAVSHRQRRCGSGHPWTPENTRVEKRRDGQVRYICRICDRLRQPQKTALRRRKRDARLEQQSWHCEFCQQEFKAKHIDARFCSTKCKDAERSRRRRSLSL